MWSQDKGRTTVFFFFCMGSGLGSRPYAGLRVWRDFGGSRDKRVSGVLGSKRRCNLVGLGFRA